MGQTRKVKTATVDRDGAVLVTCDDGTVFRAPAIGEPWEQLPPIPGTAAAQQA